MISASEVAKMYSAPMQDDMSNTTKFYVQLGQQQMQQQRENKLRQEQMNANFDKELIGKIAASGTPYDVIGIEESQKALNDIAKFNKQNPKATPEQKRIYAMERTQPVIANTQLAKTAYSELAEREKAFKDKYIDTDKYRQDFTRELLYDENGMPRQKLTLDVLQSPNLDVSNLDVAEKYVMDSKLLPSLQKIYKESLQANPYTIPNVKYYGNLADVTVYPNQYQRVKPDYSGVEFNTNLVSVGDKTYETFPQELSASVEQTPEYNIQKRRVLRALESENPLLKDAPENVKDKIAAAELAKQFGLNESAKKVDVNYKPQEMLNQKAKDEEQRKYRNAMLAMSRERLDISKKKTAEKANSNDPSTIFDALLVSTITDKTTNEPIDYKAINRLQRVKSEKVMPEALTMALPFASDMTRDVIAKTAASNPATLNEKAQKAFSQYDVSGLAKGGIFQDPMTTKTYKLYAIVDQLGKKTTFVRKYMKKDKGGWIDDIDAQAGGYADNGAFELVKDKKKELINISSYFKGNDEQKMQEQIEPIFLSEYTE